MEQERYIQFLEYPSTTLDLVKLRYKDNPRLNGFMVEDLVHAGKLEILHFLASVDWFCMGGRNVYTQLFPNGP
jgi:hypothetical protein